MFRVHLRKCILLLLDEIFYISKSIYSKMQFKSNISFLIFYLDDLSIVESEVSKSPTLLYHLFPPSDLYLLNI